MGILHYNPTFVREIAGKGEDGRVDGDVGEEDTKVEAESGMQVEKDLVLSLDYERRVRKGGKWVEGRGCQTACVSGLESWGEGAYHDARPKHNPMYTILELSPICKTRSRYW